MDPVLLDLMEIGNLSPIIEKDRIVAVGIEGSANKIGVGMNVIYITCVFLHINFIGVISYENGEYCILSNPRKTFITPPGQGFLPRETSWHHQNHIVGIIRTVREE